MGIVERQDLNTIKLNTFYKKSDIMKKRIISMMIVFLLTFNFLVFSESVKIKEDTIVGSPNDKYIIITSEEFKNFNGENSFHDLIDYHSNEGYDCEIVSVESIENSYNGMNIEEKIRNFIRDEKPKYVLLGGDHEIIPVKYLWADLSNEEDVTPKNIPSDNYYSSIDGEWNNPASDFFPSDDKALTPDDGISISGDGIFGAPVYNCDEGIMHWSCVETDPDIGGCLNFVFDEPVDLYDLNWINFDLNVFFSANEGKTRDDIVEEGGIWWSELEVRYYNSGGSATRVWCSTDPIWTGWKTVKLDYRRTKSERLEDTKRIEIKVCTPVVDWTPRADITPDDYVEIKNLHFCDYNDDVFGEPGEDDLEPDVALGRACVDTTQEISNFVKKTLSYLNTADNSPYLQEAFLMSNSKNKDTMNKIADGTSSTLGLKDGNYNCTKYCTSNEFWPDSQEIADIKSYFDNNNTHIVFSSGHGTEKSSMALAINTRDVKDMANSNFFFEFSTGCSSGRFDDHECYAEYITAKTEHGAFAGIWNTRPSYLGPIEFLAKHFWDAVCREEIREIGLALNYAKAKCSTKILSGAEFYRAGSYELSLFGDPAVQIKHPPSSTNNPPNTPDKPIGENKLEIGKRYWYKINTTDPDGDRVKYGWDWDGDGDIDEWTGFNPSGEEIRLSHSWEEADIRFEIRVKAVDASGLESEWSESLTVTMPKSIILINSIIENLIDRFPIFVNFIQLMLNI